MTLIRTVVIDDDREIAGIHTGFLLAQGAFEVVGAAYSGHAGLSLIAAVRPDLILLDIHLPDISGIEVLRRTRNLPGKPIDVIAITAARELETVRAAMAGGVLHYLVKPFTSSVLIERLEQYVRHRQVMERSLGELDQEKIDRLLAPQQSTQNPPGGGNASREHRIGGIASDGELNGRVHPLSLPKGLSLATLTAVYTDLRTNPPGASASEVAGRLGLARVSARRYLEFLVSQGKAAVTPKYGVAGRPEKIYAWTSR